MEKTKMKQIAVFTVISLVLVAAVVGGMFWAKSRAEFYASSPKNTSAQTEVKPPEATPAKTPDEKPVDKPTSAPASTPAPATATQPAAATPAVVPSTGPEDAVLPILSLSALAFAGTRFYQTRRNLLSLR